jgi:hypothetical protein
VKGTSGGRAARICKEGRVTKVTDTRVSKSVITTPANKRVSKANANTKGNTGKTKGIPQSSSSQSSRERKIILSATSNKNDTGDTITSGRNSHGSTHKNGGRHTDESTIAINKDRTGDVDIARRTRSANKSYDDDDVICLPPEVKAVMRNGKTTLLRYFSPRTPRDDEGRLNLIQVEFIEGFRLLIADCRNQSLKLFLETGQLMDELVLEDYPQDMTMLDVVTAAVITYRMLGDFNRSIKLITVSETLAQYANISLSFEPDHIVGCNGQLAVTCSSAQDRSVKLLTRDGKLIKSVNADINGLPLFNNPRHVTTNMPGNILYVGEHVRDSHEVVALTTDTGTVRCRHVYPLRPTGALRPKGGVVDTDAAGNVYMCDRQKVHQVASDGKYIRELPLGAHAHDPLIQVISFCPDRPLRFVTTGAGDLVDWVRLWTFE